MRQVVFGRVDGDVGCVIRSLRAQISDKATCVVRSIDSIHDIDDLRHALDVHGVKSSVLLGNVCILGSDLYAAAEARVFSGFDEVWIYSGLPPQFSLAELPGATSDTTDFSEGFPDVLRRAFEESRCTLLLADGNGLNFATVTQPIADELLHNV